MFPKAGEHGKLIGKMIFSKQCSRVCMPRAIINSFLILYKLVLNSRAYNVTCVQREFTFSTIMISDTLIFELGTGTIPKQMIKLRMMLRFSSLVFDIV